MSSADDYRTNAEDCLRMATSAAEERDRPLWATMAQSWLRLAQHAERLVPATEVASDESHVDGDHDECVTLAPGDLADSAVEALDEDEDPTASPRLAN